MKIKKFINENINKINLFVIILDHLKDEYNNKYNYNILKVISEFFLKILNNENIEDSKVKFFSDIKEKNLTLLKNINFNKNIKINKIKYNIIHNSEQKEYTIKFNIKYNNNQEINIFKLIPEYIYRKIHIDENKKKEKYLFLFYIMVGFDTGQFWGLHPYIYNFINKHYNNCIECFASPFNNNLNQFCSLLYPIDKYYGSKGDFFENFMKLNNDVYIINPPFVETILVKVCDMIEKKLENNYIQIFLYIPQWDDIFLPWYKRISNKYNTILCKLDKNDSIVYDYIANKPMKATFGTYFVYINSLVKKFCTIMKTNQKLIL